MNEPSAESPLEQTFEQHLAEVNRSGARWGYILVAVLVPGGASLEYFTHEDKLWPFLFIRLGAALLSLAFLGLTYIEPLYRRMRIVIDSIMPILPAAAIEAMILQLGGVHSEYYAGLNLVILAMAILFTWTWRHALAVSSIIFAMWALPALPVIAAGQIDWALFFSNSYFLIITVVIATSSVAVRYGIVQREFEARKALAETSAELASTLAQLREADRLKNEFFANVSHELRTPLTLIMAPVDEMLGAATGAMREGLEIVRRNSSRLLRMIDDLLELARLEGGSLRLHVAPLDLGEIVQRVVEAAKPTARRNGQEISLRLDEDAAKIFGDPHRVEIVLTNLVGNALKFTPRGGKISIAMASDEAHVYVDVRDTGPGIPEEQRERIFERFYQIYGSERRRHGGAGIGLALARDLARLHGGDLTVTSSEGEGASFLFSLPIGRDQIHTDVVERRKAHVPEHPGRRFEDRSVAMPALEPPGGALPIDSGTGIRFERGRRARILVAEDEDDLRAFLGSILRPRFDVLLAANGEDALALAREARPDLVLTDVMMPGTSGTDLCRAIKAEPLLRATPVIMLTARSGADAALEGYASGADDFVAKPFHVQVLLARIRAHLTLRSLTIQIADRARLESAGILAAGVAHEVRNPVNAVMSAARVLGEGNIAPSQEKRLLEVLIDGVKRIDQVVSILDAQVRPADGMMHDACSVRDGIESTIKLFAHRCDGVDVHRDYVGDAQAKAPARAFNQIFLNLLDNAVRSGGSNVWVRVESAGEELVVSVEDDGEGISPEHASRLFDPFFTARSSGDGTGLGLFLSQRLARECGGELGYRPRSPSGAEFVVRLPRLGSPA